MTELAPEHKFAITLPSRCLSSSMVSADTSYRHPESDMLASGEAIHHVPVGEIAVSSFL